MDTGDATTPVKRPHGDDEAALEAAKRRKIEEIADAPLPETETPDVEMTTDDGTVNTEIDYDDLLAATDEQAVPSVSDAHTPVVFAPVRDPVLRRVPNAAATSVATQPIIVLDPKNPELIQQVVISAGVRTPSPHIGGMMGDHTISWSTVVDAVRARLYGKTLPEAIKELRRMQEHADAWMDSKDSATAKQFARLPPEDREKRAAGLSDWSWRVVDLLKLAEEEVAATNTSAAINALQSAIAYHLSYENFVPLATVPAAGSAGSKGSGEGSHRARIIDRERETTEERTERERRQAIPAPVPDKADSDKVAESGKAEESEEAKKTREEAKKAQAEREAQIAEDQRVVDALWGMISLDAAMRATGLRYAFNPPDLRMALEDHVSLTGWWTTLQDAAKNESLGEVAEPISKDAAKMMKRLNHEIDTKPAEAQATTRSGRTTNTMQRLGQQNPVAVPQAATRTEPAWGLPAAKFAAGTIHRVAQAAADRVAERADSLSKQAVGLLKPERATAAAALKTLDAAMDTLKDRAKDSSTLAVEDLARLMHAFQVKVADSFPIAVSSSGFLKAGDTGARDAALDRLKREIDRLYPTSGGYDRSKLDEIVTAFEDAYDEAGDPPALATNSDWAEYARNTHLVVSYNEARNELTINGRAAAPPAVRGMGSHTTAWIAEINAVTRIVTGAGSPTKAVAALQAEVRRDLTSAIAKLDWLLPGDQLARGQLVMMLDQADAALQATDVAAAVTAYLSFRNLLPFATVDEGNRTGHGERRNADPKKLYDELPLIDTAGSQNKKLRSDRKTTRDKAAKALLEAAANLDAEVKAASSPPAPAPAATTTELGFEVTDAKAPELIVWHAPEVIAAATGSAVRLRARAKEVSDNKLPATGKNSVASTILRARRAEHNRVIKLGTADGSTS
jgi:hypothetical protein